MEASPQLASSVCPRAGASRLPTPLLSTSSPNHEPPPHCGSAFPVPNAGFSPAFSSVGGFLGATAPAPVTTAASGTAPGPVAADACVAKPVAVSFRRACCSPAGACSSRFNVTGPSHAGGANTATSAISC